MLNLIRLKSEVLQKIGRNLFLFQKMEGLLKYITYHQNLSSPLDKIADTQEKSFQDVKCKTMGQLIKTHLVQDTNHENNNSTIEEENSISLNIDFGPCYYEYKTQVLKDLLDERNNLVHHSYINFDLNSINSCLEVQKQLDSQETRILSEINSLQGIVTTIQKSKHLFIDYIKSDAYENQIRLAWLQSSPLVLLLKELEHEISRENGWSYLGEAGELINKRTPDERVLLQKNYGCRSLKSLIVSSKIFDIREEGSRCFYRTKPS